MKTTNEANGREIRAKGAGTMAKCADACIAVARKLKQLEEQFIAKLSAEAQNEVPQQVVEQVMNEAGALAWNTRFPLLFLPDLAEEKIASARQWAARQQDILRR
jgi:hypothetical protein